MNNTTDRIQVFLSVGEPHTDVQERYVSSLCELIYLNGLKSVTLGRDRYSLKKPLDPICDLMKECHGIILLCMERFHSMRGIYKEGSPESNRFGDQYFTTVWNQIEGALGYQLGLPMLILKERKLVPEGLLDSGVHTWQVLKVDPSNPYELRENSLKGYFDQWISEVNRHYYKST